MDFMLLKKFSILFLLISASFLSTSFAADRRSKFVHKLAKEVDAVPEVCNPKPLNHKEASGIHERLLIMNANDYGISDPPPALVKSPSKPSPS